MSLISKGEDGGNNHVAHALALAARGLAVFPLQAKSKAPWPLSHGHLDASTDAETIEGWWDGWPDANIAVATGERSGIFVVDIDGERGEESLHEIYSRFGPLPHTVEVLTGKGRHLYFKLPTFDGAPQIRNTASAVAAGIDTRGEGGFVVVPPSVHPNGTRYRWATNSASEIAEPPVWLIALLTSPPSVASLDARRGHTHWSRIIQDGVPEGARNQTATSLAGKLLRAGILPVDAFTLLCGWNAYACRPPLPDQDIEHIVVSVAKTARRRAGETV